MPDTIYLVLDSHSYTSIDIEKVTGNEGKNPKRLADLIAELRGFDGLDGLRAIEVEDGEMVPKTPEPVPVAGEPKFLFFFLYEGEHFVARGFTLANFGVPDGVFEAWILKDGAAATSSDVQDNVPDHLSGGDHPNYDYLRSVATELPKGIVFFVDNDDTTSVTSCAVDFKD